MGLKLRKPKHDFVTFCHENSLTLKVSWGLVGEAFKKAGEKALLHACVAWNGIDGSQKHRIKLPAADTSTDIKLAHALSESDKERTSDSEAED